MTSRTLLSQVRIIERLRIKDRVLIDPACGSGHILVYAFDLLFAMYEEEGYNPEDIPQMILERNLRGLEIDPRAAEIAKFALEMKARERDPRFLERDVDADIAVLEPVELEPRELSQTSRALRERTALLDAMAHMDEAGSLYVPDAGDAEAIRHERGRLGDPRGDDVFRGLLRRKLETMLANVEALSGTYHCVIANPPYMGSGNMGPWLSGWVKENYPDEKGDLCTCFIKRGLRMVDRDGYSAMITASSWMFISSFEKLRHHVIDDATILTMTQLSTHGFPNVTVPTCMWVMCGERLQTKGTYIRLEDFDRPQWQQPRTLEAVSDPGCPWRYEADAESFKAIPGWPIAYWATRNVINAFNNGKPINQYMDCHSGISVNTQKFVRYWTEVSRSALKTDCTSSEDMADYRWFPMNSGGDYRLFYGNNSKVVDLWHEGVDVIRNGGNFRLREPKLYFKMGLTWGRISSSDIAFRKVAKGTLFGDAGPVGFTSKGVTNYLLGFLVSSVMQNLVEYLNPTMNYQITDIVRLPLLIEQDSKVDGIVSASIETCKIDWDAFETSWDFESHPLAQPGESLVERQFERWRRECQSRFDELKANEEELNRIFARIYHMEDEVPIEVPDDKVSVRRADLARDVRSLVSYGVGCILGRYSLDRPGLVLADQGSTVADYLDKVPEPRLMPDADNVLPITDTTWFDDDIVDSFYRFLAAAYGEDTLGDNVAFIEGALGCDLRTYFLKHFYADHVRTYQKRPIYWLFQSPKKTFSCLVYTHRYDESTVGEILTGYLRPLQGKLRSRIELLEKSKSARDAREANRLRAQVQELADWERDVIYPLAHERVSIDLDDGVKVNYNKFPHALAKVPGLSNWK